MEKNNRRVVITGMGVIAPNGIGIDQFWESLINGRSGISKISCFDASTYPSQIAGEVKDFNPTDYINPKNARRMDRFSQFAVVSTKMALEDSRLEINEKNSERIGISLGSALGGIPSAEAQHSIFIEKGLKRVDPLLATKIFSGASVSQVSLEFGIKGHSNSIGGGCGVGTDSIGYGFYAIKNKLAEIMITGGAEAPLAPLTFGAFCIIGALSKRNEEPTKASRPFDNERDGFVMSEGAGILILEELDSAIKRGAPIYAEIIGYGTTNDAYSMVHPLESGEQALKGIKITFKNAGVTPEEIDYINAHGSSTRLNDKIETKIIKEIFGERAFNIPISSIKSMIGHPMGAAGAIEVIATILAIKNQFIPPTINYEFPDPDCDLDYVPNIGRKAQIKLALKNSFSFGGKNSFLLIKRFE